MYLSERNLYGSSRVGTEDLDVTMILGTQTPVTPATNAHYTNSIADKRYELSNHLGNVLNVITDRKLWLNTSSQFSSSDTEGWSVFGTEKRLIT